MNVMLTPNEVAARVWDDYLHRFGAEAYVTARYLASPPTIPRNEDAGLTARSFEADAYHSEPRLQTSADPSAIDRGLAVRRGRRVRPVAAKAQLASRNIPTSTTLRVRSSSQSIGSSANSPIRSARSKSGEHEDVEQLSAGSRPERV